MALTRICKNCFQSYKGKPDVCPHCGEPTGFGPKNLEENNTEEEQNTQKVKKAKKRRHHVSSKEIMDSIDFETLLAQTNDKDVNSWKEKQKKKDKIEATIDSSGEINVDTTKESYLPQTYTYSVKKARGEYTKPDIKWWEIYKWADVWFVRRKIKKQVNRASHYKPTQFSKTWMIILAILFGWMGAHNFYARNYKKGWFVLIAFILGCVAVFHPAFAAVKVSIGGGLLFIDAVMWGLDIINLIINQYSYRLSKWKFIDSLNTDTRAKLGYKYIDKEEYKKLWIVRLCHAIKRKSEENKEKRKLKAEEKQNNQGETENSADKQENITENSEKTDNNNVIKMDNTKVKNKQPSKNVKNKSKTIKINKYKK